MSHIDGIHSRARFIPGSSSGHYTFACRFAQLHHGSLRPKMYHSSHLTICGPVPTRVIYSALQFTAFWDLSSCFYHYSTLWLWNIPDSQSVIIGRCVEASERRE